jgi:hypothetical protein
MSSLSLLGPQFRTPNLRGVLAELGLQGPFVSISAGWQEREGELDELRAYVDAEVHDLRIYERSERVFEQDPALRREHRQRQSDLREMRELYQLQLTHAKDAARELFERDDSPALLRRAHRQAIAALHRLDRAHLAAIRTIHREFTARTGLPERPAVAGAAAQIARYVQQANAVFIAGGHVAVLLNRLRLLGGAALFAGKPVVAWSAGAMAMTDTVVLFHDSPPQGRSNVEVFDEGLCLARHVIVLPHAATRLHLDDTTRVRILARRFAPARCLTLDAGAALQFSAGNLQSGTGSRQLRRDGTLAEVDG